MLKRHWFAAIVTIAIILHAGDVLAVDTTTTLNATSKWENKPSQSRTEDLSNPRRIQQQAHASLLNTDLLMPRTVRTPSGQFSRYRIKPLGMTRKAMHVRYYAF